MSNSAILLVTIETKRISNRVCHVLRSYTPWMLDRDFLYKDEDPIRVLEGFKIQRK